MNKKAQLLIVKEIFDDIKKKDTHPESTNVEKGNSLYVYSDNLEFFYNPVVSEIDILKDNNRWTGKVKIGENDLNGLKVQMKKFGSDLMFIFNMDNKERQVVLQMRFKL